MIHYQLWPHDYYSDIVAGRNTGMVWYCIAGSSTVDGHHRDSVECVTDQFSEGFSVHWLSIISYDHRSTSDRNTTNSGWDRGHCEMVFWVGQRRCPCSNPT